MHFPSIRGFALLLVFAATLAAFSSSANALDLQATMSEPPPPADGEIDAAFQRGQLTAIMDVDAVFALPPEQRPYSFRIKANVAEMAANMMRLMGAPLGFAFFEGRASVFNAAADAYGEPLL